MSWYEIVFDKIRHEEAKHPTSSRIDVDKIIETEINHLKSLAHELKWYEQQRISTQYLSPTEGV